MAPPRTVGSWAETRHSTPSTTPIPTIDDAPTWYSVPQAARAASSRKAESRSSRSSMRSRAEELAPLSVALDVALASAGPGRGQLLVDAVERLGQGALVGPEGVRGRVDGGGRGWAWESLDCGPDRVALPPDVGRIGPMTFAPRHVAVRPGTKQAPEPTW